MRHFCQQRYSDAVTDFEAVYELTKDRKEESIHTLSSAYVGRSYLQLGEIDLAVESLSRAYGPYRRLARDLRSELPKREFIEFLTALAAAHAKRGDDDLAAELREEACTYERSNFL